MSDLFFYSASKSDIYAGSVVCRARTPPPTADKVSPAVIWHSPETLANFAFVWQTLLQVKEAAAESGSAFRHKENVLWVSQRRDGAESVRTVY